VSDGVQSLKEIDSFKIFAAAIAIRDPLTFFARIVEVEHGGDSVHAKAVDVVFVEPEERVGDKVVADFVAAVIVNERAPIGMSALARVGMFEEMSAVELREAVRIAWEMGRGPIKKNADAFLVAAVDEVHEISGSAETAGGGVVAEGLIAPGAVKRMLHDGEKFDVRVAELLHVGEELFGEFAIREPAIVFFRNPAPRAKMDFVD